MKPFKPLSIIPRQTTAHSEDASQGPAKRRKLTPEHEHLQKKQAAKPPLASRSLLAAPRAPLQQIAPSNGPPQKDQQQLEAQYFSVLWRRPTTKKNKTWDGDGILAVSEGFVTLQDASGKQLGKIAYNKSLNVGSQLIMAGREVELESTMSKRDAISGQRFLGKAPAPLREVAKNSLVQKPRNDLAALCRSTQVTGVKQNDFKLPMARPAATQPSDGRIPTPRHDPEAPEALVMKRPKVVPKGKHIVDVVVDPLLSKHLRPHQREGVSFLYDCVMGFKDYTGQGAILADEMGLGKTLQTIALIWTLLKQNPIYDGQSVIKKALIVCPVTLVNNWRKEFRKWLSNERMGVMIADDKHTRITDFTRGKAYSVMIVGYERLRSIKDELLKGDGVDLVVCDEGHRLKTAKNKSADAIKSLPTERRIILSGTPIQNDLEEFYHMVDLVNSNLLGKYSVFKREFEVPILKSQQPGASQDELEKGEARSQELADITGLFILRRTADILSSFLPSKTEYIVYCKPSKVQADVYRSIVKSPIFSAALGSSGMALELINVLKKVCNSPSLLLSKGDKDEEATRKELFESVPTHLLKHRGSSVKLQVLDSLLHTIRSTTTEKVVLVSNYTSTLDVLQRLLSSLGYSFLRLDGSTPASKRQGLVDTFNRSNANNCFVFLLSAKAGGVGLNLIGASRLVLYDLDWNPATDLQAMGRIHRDGQKRPCYIYRLITKGAIEEKILQRQTSKTGLADSIVDGKSSSSSFTRDELRDLFTLDESSGCQTHRLLGCPCKEDGSAHDDSEVSPAPRSPEPLLEPTLADDRIEVVDLVDAPYVSSSNVCSSFTNSSAVDMQAQEEELRSKGKQCKDSAGRNKLLGLMQYLHLDTTKIAKLDEHIDAKDVVGDAALYNVLSEDGERVEAVFVKKSSSAVAV